MEVLNFDSKTGELTLKLKLDLKGRPSASGKTMVHFSTSGNQRMDNVLIGGAPLTIGINAYTPKK